MARRYQKKAAIRPADLTRIVKDIIYADVKELADTVEDAMDEATDAALREVKRGSKVKTGNYKEGWIKEGRHGNWRIRNENAPQLTHILNDGTKKRQTESGANRGWVKPDRHIQKAQKAGEKIIYDKVMKKLGG